MRFQLKVRRGARALVMLVRTGIGFDEFVTCRCDEHDFDDALRYAQSHVALPTFVVGGDFAIEVASRVLDLRGVVAIEPTNAAAVARLQVPVLLIGGSEAVAASAPDASHLSSTGDTALIARVAARFIGAYA
jgi:hypothetical protein